MYLTTAILFLFPICIVYRKMQLAVIYLMLLTSMQCPKNHIYFSFKLTNKEECTLNIRSDFDSVPNSIAFVCLLYNILQYVLMCY